MTDPMSPGFRQERQPSRGIHTGRVSPRTPVKDTARSKVLNDNGIEPIHQNQVWSDTSTGYDPDQGSLFDVSHVAPRSVPADPAEHLRSIGAPSGRVSDAKGKEHGLMGAPGFLPGLSTHKQKIAALNNVAEGRIAQGTYRGGGHIAEMMEDRERVRNRAGNADWYEGTDEHGNHDRSMGHAPGMIQATAAAVGTTTNAVTRATAITSPQAGWQGQDGEYGNVAAARDSIRAAQTTRAANPHATTEDIRKAGSALNVSGGVLPENTGKAAAHFDTHGDVAGGNYQIQDRKSMKAPNFEASLHTSHKDPVVRKMASEAWTVDRHDSRIVGMDAEQKEFKRVGTMDVVAMTGTRTALRHGQTGPNEQARQWVGQKSLSEDSPHDAPRLFHPDTHNISPNARLAPIAPPPRTRTQQRQQSPADKYGLEF